MTDEGLNFGVVTSFIDGPFFIWLSIDFLYIIPCRPLLRSFKVHGNLSPHSVTSFTEDHF